MYPNTNLKTRLSTPINKISAAQSIAYIDSLEES